MPVPAWFAKMAAVLAASMVLAGAAPTRVISDLDLSKAFATREPWHFTAVQEPPIDDPVFGGAVAWDKEKVPGRIQPCLRQGASPACDPALRSLLRTGFGPDDIYADPHQLDLLRIVRPGGLTDPPLLLIRMSSLQGVNGDQGVLTQALTYRAAEGRFVRVYEILTGHNNNQEARYIEQEPLRGDIISVTPTQDAPFAFWVSVNAPGPDNAYREVLRYRSATRYGDGNPLAVIDSEMPEIQRRLGLWRPGAPPPLPARGCPKPRMVGLELWCG